jgi:hypothetical protein
VDREQSDACWTGWQRPQVGLTRFERSLCRRGGDVGDRVRENLATFLVALLSVVAIAVAIIGILRSGFHDPVWPSFVANLAIAIATLILMWQSVEISRRQLEGQRRSILIPESPPFSPHEKFRKGGGYFSVRIRNVGSGAALEICGLLMYRPDDRKALPTQFFAFEALPIAPGSSRDIAFRKGVRLFTGKERIGGIPLGISRKAPGPENIDPTDRRPGWIARLTLTWWDEAGLKHAAIFDLDYAGVWHHVSFRAGIREDLRDLNEKKGREIRWAARLSRLSAFMRRLQFLLRPRFLRPRRPP